MPQARVGKKVNVFKIVGRYNEQPSWQSEHPPSKYQQMLLVKDANASDERIQKFAQKA